MTILPVVVTGALLGRTAGVLTAPVILPLNLFLYAVVEERPSLAGHVGPCLIVALVGGIVGHLRDLRLALESKQAELNLALRHENEASLALKDREMQLELAQEASRTGSYVWTISSGKLSWSAELFRQLGLDPGIEPTHELFLRHVHPDDRAAVQRNVERTLQERIATETEHRVVRADGQVRWIQSTGRMIVDGSGQLLQVVGTSRDITEYKQIQAKLTHAERMASLGTLARGVAHEINNPLSYVLSNLRFVAGELADLQSEPLPPERLAEARKALGDAVEGATRVRSIVQNLQVFSRAREELGPVDVKQVFDLALHIVDSQIRYRARLVRDYRDVLPIQADESCNGQVLLNLLVNATHAIPEGHPHENEIRVGTRMEGTDRVALEVQDTGAGIPPEIRHRIFEPFFTTKPVGVGTGLGLSICLGIVNSLGGEITVESEVGRGSTFRVMLPVERDRVLERQSTREI
ncbi:MAG TPA: ATP-binding protein [Anaeromyxobacteraceae bacterium]|nr:ATP-binding protein [Anaeromyxobacteraceae bacterium]